VALGGAVVAGEELDAARPWLGEELAIAGEGMPLPDMACVPVGAVRPWPW